MAIATPRTLDGTMPAETGRPGRPVKVDDAGTGTRERLLAAAIASCIEHGFEAATVSDIAKRADVSGPAIYNHFGGKVELLVAAGRWALERLSPEAGARVTPAGVARIWLADGFADTRRLLTELHAAAQRHPDVADLLASWHRDQAAVWVQRVGDAGTPDAAAPDATAALASVKTFFALLLGLCQMDSMSALVVPPAALEARVDALTRTLFPEQP